MNTAVERMMKEYGVERIEVGCDDCEHYYDCADFKCPIDYPPFTAQKQIELIKLIYTVSNFVIYRGFNDSLEDVIAERVTAYKDLLDNAKVKEILEK